MAQRKGGSVAAPAKQKLRKNHGPKRKLFHDYDQTTRMAFGKTGMTNVVSYDENNREVHSTYVDKHDGLLTKYNNYESFALSCAARGAKSGVKEMWNEFKVLSRPAQDEYLANVKENAVAAIKRAENKKKKAAKKSDK